MVKASAGIGLVIKLLVLAALVITEERTMKRNANPTAATHHRDGKSLIPLNHLFIHKHFFQFFFFLISAVELIISFHNSGITSLDHG